MTDARIKWIALTLAVALPALAALMQAQDSGDDDAQASPTPRHRHSHHASPSPSASPGQRHHHSIEESSPAGEEASPTPRETPEESAYAPDASLEPEQLGEFSKEPEKMKSLLQSALELTKQNLTYTYSSDDPANGGMDCSGFVYYVLKQSGFSDVPRESDEQYLWVRKAGNFRAVLSRSGTGFEMDELKPGDLLFWTGTYNVDRDIPVTHAMIYLGTEKGDGRRVMVGSSDGRSYRGKQRWGVSVFDFNPARPASSARPGAQFVGYGRIPGM